MSIIDDDLIQAIEMLPEIKKYSMEHDTMYRYFNSFCVENSFVETKRYSRLQQTYRKALNQFIVDNFESRLGDASNVNNIGNYKEPIYNFCRDNIITKFSIEVGNAICHPDEDQLKKVNDYYRESFCYHGRTSYYSPANKYLAKFAVDFAKSLPKKADKVQVATDSKLMLNMSKKIPVISTFLSYLIRPDLSDVIGIPSFSELFNAVFDNVFYDYIHERISMDSTINEDNYVTYLKPTDKTDLLPLLIDVNDAVVTEAEGIFAEMCIPAVNSKASKILKENRKILERNESEVIDKCQKALDEANNSTKKLETENKALQDKVAQLEKVNRDLAKEDKNTIYELNKEIKSLKKQLEEANAKYDESNEYFSLVEQALNEPQEDDDADVEIDTTKRYIFVSSKSRDGYALNNNLLKEFPNSEIKYGTFNVQANSTDLVVVLTSYVKHCTYYGIKEQCRSKGVPMIHCYKRSVNSIKRTIAEANVF